MATELHPLTGVVLNSVSVERIALGYNEAVTVHLMRQAGEKFQIIAQKLGTNPARVGEVLRGDVHPGAAEVAARMNPHLLV